MAIDCLNSVLERGIIDDKKSILYVIGGVSMLNKLKLEDLYEGRRVSCKELDSVLDTYIILTDIVGFYPDFVGTVAYVTKKKDSRSDELILSGKCRCVYNDSFLLNEGVYYDE